MNGRERRARSRRSYPALYEKMIPIVLGIIVLATIAVIAFAAAVALRLVPGDIL